MFLRCIFGLSSLFLLFGCSTESSRQTDTDLPIEELVIGFYNVENLFDTHDDPQTDDEEFLPKGERKWTEERYQNKLTHLAEAIRLMEYPALLGLAEVENQQVLQDLIDQTSLEDQGYEIIHDESPDARGIDVALLYREGYFTPFRQESLELKLDGGSTTREILLVGGTVSADHDTIYLMVNHWPSRGGGVSKTAPRREKAARLARQTVDQIVSENTDARIILMGDFNDEPTNRSLYRILEANGKQETLDENDLFNPMYALQQQGKGSYRYRDDWNMLDQIILSQALLSNNSKDLYYQEQSARIIENPALLQQTGKFAGHPNRTYAGNRYLGGYSDHLPVTITLKDKTQPQP